MGVGGGRCGSCLFAKVGLLRSGLLSLMGGGKEARRLMSLLIIRSKGVVMIVMMMRTTLQTR